MILGHKKGSREVILIKEVRHPTNMALIKAPPPATPSMSGKNTAGGTKTTITTEDTEKSRTTEIGGATKIHI